MGRKRSEGAAFKADMRERANSGTDNLKPGDKNWEHPCDACGELPTVHPVGLCGPCAFGEAETYGGNW